MVLIVGVVNAEMIYNVIELQFPIIVKVHMQQCAYLIIIFVYDAVLQ